MKHVHSPYQVSRSVFVLSIFFGSIKGWFQLLQELHIPIQSQNDLDYANMWICLCLILHNFIVKIKGKLNHTDSNVLFYKQPWRPRRTDEEDDQQEGRAIGDQTYIGSVGQDFCNTLKTQLPSLLASRN
jgi:hypothetical protein